MIDRDKLSDIELCWDQFSDWCEDNGVDVEGHKDDWEPWWDCWSTAVVAKMTSDAEGGES